MLESVGIRGLCMRHVELSALWIVHAGLYVLVRGWPLLTLLNHRAQVRVALLEVATARSCLMLRCIAAHRQGPWYHVLWERTGWMNCTRISWVHLPCARLSDSVWIRLGASAKSSWVRLSMCFMLGSNHAMWCRSQNLVWISSRQRCTPSKVTRKRSAVPILHQLWL